MVQRPDENAPQDPVVEGLRQDALASIESYRTFLASPAFLHAIDLAVLVKIAGDDKADIRERRRAAEVLAKLRLQAMEGLAELVGVREQSLDRLGIKSGGPSVALTQVNQKIEIVRASDWRSAAPLEPGDATEVEVLPAGTHETNGQKQEAGDAADPAS